ncbi:unnamed protein product [Prunus brigantina]
MTLIAVSPAKCTQPIHVHRHCTGAPRPTSLLTVFEAGGDGGGPSECDNKYHNDNTPVVALSTGWYNNGGSVTLLRDVMQTMTTNLLVLTTLLMLQRPSGKPWVCLRTTGVA